MDDLKAVVRLKEAGVTNPGRLVALIMSSKTLYIYFFWWREVWILIFILYPKHDYTEKKGGGKLSINSKFWYQLFPGTNSSLWAWRGGKRAGLAAKFGCQMAGESAWYYTVWSTTVQFSVFSVCTAIDMVWLFYVTGYVCVQVNTWCGFKIIYRTSESSETDFFPKISQLLVQSLSLQTDY